MLENFPTTIQTDEVSEREEGREWKKVILSFIFVNNLLILP